MNRISPSFPPVFEVGSGASEEFCGGAVNESHSGILPPTAAFPQATDAPVDGSSERGAKSEHTGTGLTRNNTGPSAQHLDGGAARGVQVPLTRSSTTFTRGRSTLGIGLVQTMIWTSIHISWRGVLANLP